MHCDVGDSEMSEMGTDSDECNRRWIKE
jgi:hypothetical protein